MDGRWTIVVCRTCGVEDAYHQRFSEHDFDARTVEVVPCDDAAIERVAQTLGRQRGYDWADAGDGLKTALIAAAAQAFRAAGETS